MIFDEEFIDWSLVDVFIFVWKAIVSIVCVLSLDRAVWVGSGRGVLIAMREVRLLVGVEGPPVLRSVPCTTTVLVDLRVGVVLYGDVYDEVEV